MPTNLKPFLNELEVQPFIGPPEVYGNQSFTFLGTMRLHFTCQKPTDKVIFHANELVVDETKLKIESSNDTGVRLSSSVPLEYDNQRQFVIVTLGSACIQDQNYTLTVPYSGVILEKLFGFYRGSYTNSKGEKF